ncbi:hypothetical protein [Lysobacter sp. HA18]
MFCATAAADEVYVGYQCSVDSPEFCTDPVLRKRYEQMQKQRNEQRAAQAAADARAAEAARQRRNAEVKDLMKTMNMSPAREAELRRLAEMREAAGMAAPHASTPERPKPECKQVPRRVSPLTPSFPTLEAAQATAKSKVANACGVKGAASINLNCRSDDHKEVAMNNGKVLGTKTTPYWYCAPIATCVDTVESCGGANNRPATGSKQ